MKVVEKLIRMSTLWTLTFTLACSGSDDKDDPNPTGGDVSVTSVNEYPLWGQVMTIKGTGFSSVKEENIVRIPSYYPGWCEVNYTTEDGGDMEIISASVTEIKVRVPFEEAKFGDCGPEYGTVEVEVKGKKGSIENVKFVGLPKVTLFEYHYGWFDIGGITRIGDSVVLGGGLQGSYWKESPWASKLRLTIDGIPVPIKFRQISTHTWGWGMFLSAKEFGEVNCSDGENGWNDRGMDFKFFVEGTDAQHTKELFVQYLPTNVDITGFEGPDKVSKLGTLNPEWEIDGENMYYDQAVFIPSSGCPGQATQTTSISPSAGIKDHVTVGIPLSLLLPCFYTVYLKDPCGHQKMVGNIEVVP